MYGSFRVLSGFVLIAALLSCSACASGGMSAQKPTSGNASSTSIIRSQADLNRYLSATAQSGSPLDALSAGGRARFLSSLTFNDQGVTGFRYDDLQAELTVSQIYNVLALFGMQQDAAFMKKAAVVSSEDRQILSATPDIVAGPGDYVNYECASRATCAPASNLICTHNC